MADSKATMRMATNRFPSILFVVFLLISGCRATGQTTTNTSDDSEVNASHANVTNLLPIHSTPFLQRLQAKWGLTNFTRHHFPEFRDNCVNCLSEFRHKITNHHIPDLLGAVQSAFANRTSTAIGLTSAPSVAILTLLGYNSYVASVRRRLEPQYRALQLLSAVAAIDDAEHKTRNWLLNSPQAQLPVLVPITLTEEDNDILVPLWNGTLDNLSETVLGKVGDGLFATVPKNGKDMSLLVEVGGDHVSVYLAANNVGNLLNQMGTDWVNHINNLLPDYAKGCCGRKKQSVVGVESVATKWAWQLWLEHQLQVDTDDIDDEPSDEDPLCTFLTPGRYTCIYREAVNEEDMTSMMARRRATFLSKGKIARPHVLLVEEPQKIMDENATTHTRRQRICVEEYGRMWYGGILPYRHRSYGWIVQKPLQDDNNMDDQRYFSIRAAPPPISPPLPPPTLQVEWDSSSHRIGFPRWGLGKITEYPELVTEPWAIEKRAIVAEAQSSDDDDPPKAAPSVSKVVLMNRPGSGWLVWTHKL